MSERRHAYGSTTILLGVVLTLGMMLVGCNGATRRPTKDTVTIPAPQAKSPPDTSPAQPRQPQGSAYLTISKLEAPSTVNRGTPFTVVVRVENRGDAVSGSFEVEARANINTPTSASSLPIGSGGRLQLKPGEGADFTFHSAPDGLNQAGIYTLRASFLPVSGQYVNSSDRHDPNTPTQQLVVN